MLDRDLPHAWPEPSYQRVVSTRAIDTEFLFEPPRLNVLIISDDPHNCHLIDYALRHMDYHEAQISTVGTLTAAIFALSSDDFDVVVTDETIDATSHLEISHARSRRHHPIWLRVANALVVPAVAALLQRDAARNLDLNALCPAALQRIIQRALEERWQAVALCPRTQRSTGRTPAEAPRNRRNVAVPGIVASVE